MLRLVLSGALAAALTATGAVSATAAPTTAPPVVIDYPGSAPTPAPAVPGAVLGGQLSWLQDGAPASLDPQEIYDALDIATQLFFRTLTGYVEDPGGGQLRLVGDLATNAGEPSADGRTWTYHLRPGSTFDDGAPVTAKDIGYGIARSFTTAGPAYLRAALDPAGTYHGPYDGGADLPPGVSTPDAATLVFTFPAPHPELPYVLALPTTTPVPKARDTRDGYRTGWVTSGPYRRRSYTPGAALVLERDPHWDPASDPIRHQYPDTISFDWTVSRTAQTDRLRAGAAGDDAAVMVDSVAAGQLAAVKADPALAARSLSGATPTARYLDINTRRVTDVAVRRALNLAFDRAGYVAAQGGADVAAPLTTILAPTVPGHREFDAYPTSPGRARDLLRGRRPALTMCLQDTEAERGYAAAARTGLERAGFRITLRPLPAADYWGLVGTRSTTCDLINSAWVADFPDADSVLRVTLDGNLLGDADNLNFSYLDDACVNRSLEELAVLSDRSVAADRYGRLDRRIMTDLAPLVPLVTTRVYSLRGARVHGVFLSGLYGRPNLTRAYLS